MEGGKAFPFFRDRVSEGPQPLKRHKRRDGGDDQGAVGGDCLEDDGWSLRMMFWNVCGWAKSGFGARANSVDNLDMRVKIFGMFQPDVVWVAETWLKDGDVAALDGYSWFGHNR